MNNNKLYYVVNSIFGGLKIVKINDELVLLNRRNIYQYILLHPGLHEREISRKIKIPYTTLRYHLNYLEKKGLILVQHYKKYVRYYPSDYMGREEKEIISCFRRKTSFKIVLFLSVYQIGSRYEISKNLEKSPATISYHLKKLIDAGIIEIAPYEKNLFYIRRNKRTVIHNKKPKEKYYRFTDPEYIYDKIITYNDSELGEEIISFILEMVDNYKYHCGKIPDKFDKRNDEMDLFINSFYDLFPHPYHA